MKVDFGAAEGAEEAEVEKEKQPVFKLAEEDVEFIYDNTHYTLKDIKEWHRSPTEISQGSSDILKYFPEALPKIVPMGNYIDRR